MKLTKHLYETEFSVIADNTLKVTAVDPDSSEKIIELFAIKDTSIISDVLWLLPVVLEKYEFSRYENTTEYISLRDTVQCLIDRVIADHMPNHHRKETPNVNTQ